MFEYGIKVGIPFVLLKTLTSYFYDVSIFVLSYLDIIKIILTFTNRQRGDHSTKNGTHVPVNS